MQRCLFSTTRLIFSLPSALIGVLVSATAGFAAALTGDAGNTGNSTTINTLSAVSAGKNQRALHRLR